MVFKFRKANKNISMRLVLLVILLSFPLVGCSTTAKRRSAIDIYDMKGNRTADSTDTFEFTQIYLFHYDDVFDAAYKALFRNGFQIEREDRDSGIIQGSVMRPHIFSGGSETVPFTVSIIVKEISAEPRTQLRMVLDTHWGLFYSSLTIKMEPPSKKFGPEIVADIQKVLSTFE